MSTKSVVSSVQVPKPSVTKKMANREIGVIQEEQASNTDSVKNWLKTTLGGKKRRKPSFEYEDGAINKDRCMPKNRMLRRSSSVGENIDKILQSELTKR